eukprot:7384804-Prymnesium_polylepis.1
MLQKLNKSHKSHGSHRSHRRLRSLRSHQRFGSSTGYSTNSVARTLHADGHTCFAPPGRPGRPGHRPMFNPGRGRLRDHARLDAHNPRRDWWATANEATGGRQVVW